MAATTAKVHPTPIVSIDGRTVEETMLEKTFSNALSNYVNWKKSAGGGEPDILINRLRLRAPFS